jgi:hypothetical protein
MYVDRSWDGKELPLSKLHTHMCPYFLGIENIIFAQRSSNEFAGINKTP